jgi:hypothetical protein
MRAINGRNLLFHMKPGKFLKSGACQSRPLGWPFAAHVSRITHYGLIAAHLSLLLSGINIVFSATLLRPFHQEY